MSTTNPHKEAHQNALKRDARDQYDVGDSLEVVLEQTPVENNGREGVARRGGLVVFVHPGQTSVEIGCHIKVRVTHVDRNYLRVIALRRLDS